MIPDAQIAAQSRSVRLCRTLLLGVGLALPGHGAVSQTRSPIQFAIAAQPLAAALDSYSVISGLELYYDGDLAVGRRSHPVEGRLVPDAALRELLTGSGLVDRATGPNSFTITPDPSSRLASATHQSYFATNQSRLSQVLCAHAETRPDSTDLLLQLWIASTGTVKRAQLLYAPNARTRRRGLETNVSPSSIGWTVPEGSRAWG